MFDFEEYLDGLLINSKKCIIMGVGSVLMSDDACGIILAESLTEKFNHNKKFKIISGSTAPENFTGEIKKFKPDLLVLVDAADMKEQPGNIMVIDYNVINGVSFSTHMLPLKLMIDYLKIEIDFKIVVIGIQPDIVDYGENISQPVKEAINDVINIFENAINKYGTY